MLVIQASFLINRCTRRQDTMHLTYPSVMVVDRAEDDALGLTFRKPNTGEIHGYWSAWKHCWELKSSFLNPQTLL